MKNLTIEKIIKALKKLGISGKATFEYINHDRIKVNVNGEYFGIWDAEKKTFVD